VRTHDQVKGRLNSMYGKRSANGLFSFWLRMATRGEDVMRDEVSRSRFYVNRKKLVDAGVSWLASNVIIIANDAALPRDFTPMRTNVRLCRTPVSSNSLFNHCPVEWGQLRAAA
ncbi:MAG: replication protein, partial [Proteobacteria bacterium]|nr:replication protein [Pseudomonadota bacterium]